MLRSGFALVTCFVMATACSDSSDVSREPEEQDEAVGSVVMPLTGFVMREQVGQLDLSETSETQHPDGESDVEPVEPPYDLSEVAGANAAELLRASQYAESRAAELGLEASVMLADSNGALYADFVDSAIAYATPQAGVIAPASAPPAADDDFAEKGLSNGIDNRLFLGMAALGPIRTVHSAESEINRADVAPGRYLGDV